MSNKPRIHAIANTARRGVVIIFVLSVFLFACQLVNDVSSQEEVPIEERQPVEVSPPAVSTQASIPFSPSGKVYYVSPSGDDQNPGTLEEPWRTIQKAADTLQAGETVLIRAGTYPEQILPANSGAEGAFITYAAYEGEEVVINGENVPIDDENSGLLHIIDLSFIRLRGLNIIHSAAAGIMVDNSNHILIEDNYTFDTVSSGIGVWGCEDVVIAGNEVELANNDGEQENITIGGTNLFEVRHNHVHHGGPGTNGGEGITVKDGSSNGKVYRNLVHDLPDDLGIYVDAWDKHTYNIEVFQNIVHDVGGDGFSLASETGGMLENIHLYNNLAFNNRLLGLSVTGCCWYGGVNHPMKDIYIYNNTFFNNGRGEWGGGIGVDNDDVENLVIRNNILSQNLSFQIAIETDLPAGMLTIDHNLIDGFRGYSGETRGEAFVEGKALFIDPQGGDFHLQIDSPAIDRGDDTLVPSVDFDNNPRPLDGDGDGQPLSDIGAFEFVPASAWLYLVLVLR